MDIFNRKNSYHTGTLPVLKSYMLIGRVNTSANSISMQVSEIPLNSEQPLHQHPPEQCYYIIKGKGLMIIEGNERIVEAGDAVYIPSNKAHGMKNIGKGVLEYVTANSPAFDADYEKNLWPCKP
jgi:quercetin dioxygenase-like cupin family protein